MVSVINTENLYVNRRGFLVIPVNHPVLKEETAKNGLRTTGLATR